MMENKYKIDSKNGFRATSPSREDPKRTRKRRPKERDGISLFMAKTGSRLSGGLERRRRGSDSKMAGSLD